MMTIKIFDEKNLTEEELESLFLEKRKKFQSAKSPEEIKKLYSNILKEFPIRYKYSTQEYARQGVEDIILRYGWFDQKLPKQGSFLDVGCADGYFALELASFTRIITGVDMLEKRVLKANKSAQELNKNAKFVLSYAENMPFEKNSFDATILSHMLEHVYDPRIVLNEATRVTKNNGYLLAVVPPTIGRDPTHIRCIESNQLRNLLKNFGNISEEYIVGTKGIGYILQVKKNSMN